MVNKTIVVDISVHKQITNYQEEMKKLMGYDVQIKDIVANAVSEYVKKARMENSKRIEVITEFPKR